MSCFISVQGTKLCVVLVDELLIAETSDVVMFTGR